MLSTDTQSTKLINIVLKYSILFDQSQRDGPNDIGDPYDQRPEEKSAYKFFSKIAGDDMEVDAMELQKVINHVFKKGLLQIITN